MIFVRLYSKPDCHLCEEAQELLDSMAAEAFLDTQVVDVEQDPVLNKLYGQHVPVLDFGNNTRLYWPFCADDVRATANGLSPAGAGTVSGPTRDAVVVFDKIIYQFAKYWLVFIGLIVLLYAGLPLLAPALMSAGYTVPANLIYSVYRLGCHQLPSRSFFVFGHQMAYCQRCAAIYTSILAAIVVFAVVVLNGRRPKPLPWQIYILFLVPMGIDGITQIVGLRHSSWELRVVTGALFGIGSAWMALPYIEDGFRDVRRTINDKLHVE